MAYETPSGKDIWDSRIGPSLDKNRAGIKSSMRRFTQERPFYFPDGKYFGYWFTFEPPPEGIHRVFHKIAKGLYYLKNQKPMPEEVEFYCIPGDETPMTLIGEPWNDYFPGPTTLCPRRLCCSVLADSRLRRPDSNSNLDGILSVQCLSVIDLP